MTAALRPLNWYVHRLRAMDAAEVLGRARETLLHKTERLAAAGVRDVRPGKASGDFPSLPAKADAPPGLRETLAADAGRLLAGRWALFGWNEVQVSSPPDWHRDHIRGVGVPANARLDHRSLPGGADARAIWEINRWAEPVRLAMHGWLNDDADAVARAQSWLADWVEKNPAGQGINWTSALEGGLRLVNFCWFDALTAQMEDGRSRLGERQRALRDSIVPAHVWWVRRYLSFGSSANNHRLGELTGLLLAVKRWPELERIAGTADGLWKHIAECVLAQFAEDGGNREQALHYHLFAFEMALHACRAMKVEDGPVMERLRRAAEFFARMSHPLEPWDYGDNDDGQIVPLTTERGRAVAEWRAWMLSCGTGFEPECRSDTLPDQEGECISYWLGGCLAKGAGIGHGQNTRATHRSQTCATGWWIAKESGMAVIERDGWKLRVDASPLGFGKLAAHGHCDALHVSIWDGDQAVVIDPGTGGYFASGELRAELASWDAHNGPRPAAGFKAPRRIGTFLWAGRHARPEIRCDGDLLTVSIRDGNVELSRVVGIQDGVVTIEDRISNSGQFRVRWTLAPECRVRGALGEPDCIGFARAGGNWRMNIAADQSKPKLGTRWVSCRFANTQESCSIEVAAQGKLKISLRRDSTGRGDGGRGSPAASQ